MKLCLFRKVYYHEVNVGFDTLFFSSAIESQRSVIGLGALLSCCIVLGAVGAANRFRCVSFYSY